jgi:hypothetical protein
MPCSMQSCATNDECRTATLGAVAQAKGHHDEVIGLRQEGMPINGSVRRLAIGILSLLALNLTVRCVPGVLRPCERSVDATRPA